MCEYIGEMLPVNMYTCIHVYMYHFYENNPSHSSKFKSDLMTLIEICVQNYNSLSV